MKQIFNFDERKTLIIWYTFWSNQNYTTEHVKNVQNSRFFYVLFLHKLSNFKFLGKVATL